MQNASHKPTEDSVVATESVEPEIVSVLTATSREVLETSLLAPEATVSGPFLHKGIHYNCTN